jgi:subtilisin family serine protease
MSKITVIFLFLIQFYSFSQNKCNSWLKYIQNEQLTPQELDVFIQGNMEALLRDETNLGIKVKYYAGNIAAVKASASALSKLIDKNYIQFIEFHPSRLKLMNDTMVVKNRIKPVKQGLAPLTQAYDGSGVIMGIIDSGIDFNHPDFKDSNGNTRVQFLWDQNQSTGSTIPQPFNYGIEWTAAQINASVCTHNDLANYGHGTHVTGTAAGNGLANGKHEGIASKADIIVVAINFNSNNSIFSDAIQYIFNKATAAGKPCVINASVGDYYGSHDATDLQSQLINNLLLAQNGRVLVAAAGNAGNIKYHVKTNLTTTDTLFTWFTNNTSDLYYYTYADTNDIKNVQFSIGVNRGNFNDLGRIPFQAYNYALQGQKVDTLKYNNKRIGIVKTNASINSSGVYELFYYIKADSINYKWRIESKGNGKHDAWNFDLISTALPTSTLYPQMMYHVMPDTISTIVSGFQCSNEVITVGNYINLNKWYDVNNTLQTSAEVAGKIKETSSGGPTRKNIIKPDVVATGANVFSAMALGMQSNLVTNLPSAVAQGSMHVQGGGTSASAPVVAGLAALYLQAFPNANHQQVKQAIMNCAFTDGFTGAVPNNVYGYGKLDGMGAMLCTIFTGDKINSLNEGIKIYPNPFSNQFKVALSEVHHGEIKLYDVTGRLLYQTEFNGNEIMFTKENIAAYKGLLFVSIRTETQTFSFKLISE